MPHPARKPYTPPTWALPPEPRPATRRYLATLEQTAARATPLPPRKVEPICFQPIDEPEPQEPFHLLDIMVAILAAWIVVAVVVVMSARVG